MSIYPQDCNGNYMSVGQQFDNSWGQYKGLAECPKNTVITGFRTKVDTGGNTGLNRVQFECKYVDNFC